MRELKFRGKRIDNGEIVYGNGCYQSAAGQLFIVDNFTFIPVEYVEELLGRDKNSSEVYENDRIIEPDGKERLVSFNELTFVEDELKEQSS